MEGAGAASSGAFPYIGQGSTTAQRRSNALEHAAEVVRARSPQRAMASSGDPDIERDEPKARVIKGVAPWERAGAPPQPTADVLAVQVADHQAALAAKEERREARRIRKEEKKRKQEEEAAKALEQTARYMYWIGFFALPLVWIVALIYFWKEHRSADANPVIKRYYRIECIMLALYTVLFMSWFIAFQVRSDALSSLSILHFGGVSPTGL